MAKIHAKNVIVFLLMATGTIFFYAIAFLSVASASDKKALLICVDRFEDEVYSKKTAILALKNDIRQLGPVLEDGGFDVTVLDTYSGSQYLATRKNILRVLNRLRKDTLSRQTLLVFFTGHGKGKYLLPYDFEPGFEDSGLEISKLIAGIKSAGAGKKFFFLDACHSGQAIDERFVMGDNDNTIDQDILEATENRKEGFFTITSSRAKENSYVNEKSDISYFTEYLVKGLKGEADGFGGNNPSNCIIELPELYDYLEKYVSEAVIKEIRPRVHEDVSQRPYVHATGSLNVALVQLKPESCKTGGSISLDKNKPVPKKEQDNEKTISQTIKSNGSPETARDGRFIAYNDGTVLDTSTNLMWAAEDNGKNVNWNDAQKYCKGYSKGGYTDWRMPTMEELKKLYDKDKSYKSKDRGSDVHLTELIQLTTTLQWSSDISGVSAVYFCFCDGDRQWMGRSYSSSYRVLPVRGSK